MKKWNFFKWTRDNQKAFADAVIAELESKASKEIIEKLVSEVISKSGGTITGELTVGLPVGSGNPTFPLVLKGKYSSESYSTEYIWRLGLSTIGTTFYIRYNRTNVISVCPILGIVPECSGIALGYKGKRWTNTYTKKINNGADIEIPAKAGTMALVSDIEDILRQHGLIPTDTTEQTEQPKGVENA